MHMAPQTESFILTSFGDGKATLKSADGKEVIVQQATIPEGAAIGDALHLAPAGHSHEAKAILNDLLKEDA